MKHQFIYATLAAFLFLSASCASHRNPAADKSAEEQSSISETKDTVLHYRFLDFRHDGSRECFLREIRKSGILTPRDFSDAVTFLGATWGLNARTDSLGRVSEVLLLTDDSSETVFSRACPEMLPFLDEPYEVDEREQLIRWSTYWCRACLRHLHTDDGGWTMSFTLSYPEPMDSSLINQWQVDAVREFQADVRSGDRERTASHFIFPFKLRYPLPPIRDKDDFLRRYDLLFNHDIEEEIVCSNDWGCIGWRGIACNSGWLLWGDMDSTRFVVTAFNTHTEAFTKAWEEEVERQRVRVHPSLRDYEAPLVVATSEKCIFRVDRLKNGKCRLSLWKDGKSMKDRPDYVNSAGSESFGGSAGYPDWMFVNGKDTVNVGYAPIGDGYYYLEQYSDGKSSLSVETSLFED